MSGAGSRPTHSLARGECGQALITVIGLATLVSAVLIAVVTSSRVDLAIAGAFTRAAEAEAAAEGGIALALVDLAGLPDWTPVLDGSHTSSFTDGSATGVRTTAGGVFVDLDLAFGLVNCSHAPPCTEGERTATTAARPWGPNNPRWRLYAWGPVAALLPTAIVPPPAGYLLVFVADDPAESDGNPDRDESPPGQGAGMVRLRAEAFGPAGARRAVEALVARPPSGVGLQVVRWTRLPG